MIAIAGIAILAMSALQYLTRPGRGDVAPLFSLSALDGKSISIEDFRGKPVLLHFWATWCGSCIKEMPSLSRLDKDFKA